MRAGRDITGALLGLCFVQLETTAHAMLAKSIDERVNDVMEMLENTKTILLDYVFDV
jgi:hypothetical protein